MPKIYSTGDQLSAADYNAVVKVAGLYGTDAGGDDTYAVTFSPVPGSIVDGDEFSFKPTTGNTGACSLNPNGLGAYAIKKWDSAGIAKVDPITGDILAGQPIRLKYDGTDMILMSGQPRPLYNAGQSSRASGAGTGTQTIAHGLGVVPRLIKITAINRKDTTNTAITHSNGNATGTGGSCTGLRQFNSGLGTAFQNASAIIEGRNDSDAQVTIAVVSALDATNITLDFTTFSSNNNCYWQWEAFA